VTRRQSRAFQRHHSGRSLLRRRLAQQPPLLPVGGESGVVLVGSRFLLLHTYFSRGNGPI
jgi:hypothetical protein